MDIVHKRNVYLVGKEVFDTEAEAEAYIRLQFELQRAELLWNRFRRTDSYVSRSDMLEIIKHFGFTFNHE